MKKLILLALAAVGVGVLVKNKSEQLKAGAAKVTSDPRVQSALATASEKAAPLREKAAPYAETVRSKAGPYADTVKEKAGPYAATVKDKVSTAAGAAAGAAGSRLHKTPDDTAADASADAAATPEAPAAPEAATEESSSTSEYGGYPPAPAGPAVTGDPLTDPIPPAEGPAEQTDTEPTDSLSGTSYGDPVDDDSTRIVPQQQPTTAEEWLTESERNDIPSADAAPGLTEYAPEPVEGSENGTDTRSFRL